MESLQLSVMDALCGDTMVADSRDVCEDWYFWCDVMDLVGVCMVLCIGDFGELDTSSLGLPWAKLMTNSLAS